MKKASPETPYVNNFENGGRLTFGADRKIGGIEGYLTKIEKRRKRIRWLGRKGAAAGKGEPGGNTPKGDSGK